MRTRTHYSSLRNFLVHGAFRAHTLLLYSAANFEPGGLLDFCVCTAAVRTLVYGMEPTIRIYSRKWSRNTTTTVYETKGIDATLANVGFVLSSLGLASGLGFIVSFRVVSYTGCVNHCESSIFSKGPF